MEFLSIGTASSSTAVSPYIILIPLAIFVTLMVKAFMSVGDMRQDRKGPAVFKALMLMGALGFTALVVSGAFTENGKSPLDISNISSAVQNNFQSPAAGAGAAGAKVPSVDSSFYSNVPAMFENITSKLQGISTK